MRGTRSNLCDRKRIALGIAVVGGGLPESWRHTLLEALHAGLDVAAGLHQRLADIPELAQTAARLGRLIHDVRHMPFARRTNPGARFVGVSLNTSSLSAAQAAEVLQRTSDTLGLSCIDPIRTGAQAIVNALEQFNAH